MEPSKLTDYIGRKATALMLNQSQLTLTPGLRVDGTLVGIDQGAYVIRTDNTDENVEFVFIPISQCRLNIH